MRSLKKKMDWCGKAQWMLIGIMVVMLVVFYVFGYRVENQRLSDLRLQIQSKQRDLWTNQSKAKILPAVAAEVRELEHRLKTFDKRLPKQQELAQFIRDITQVSQQSSLRKVEVKPGAGRKDELFSQIPITLTFEGDFMSVFSFLRQTEQMDRLTRVQSLTLKGKGEKPGEVEVQVSMDIYFSEG